MQALTRDDQRELARSLLVSAYRQLVEQVPCVDAVYIDQSAGFTIYTLYRGALSAIEDSLYRAESEARRQAPQTGTMFRLLDGTRGEDAGGLPRSAQCIDRRG